MPITQPIVQRRRLLGVGVETDMGTAVAVAAAMASTSVSDLSMDPDSPVEGNEREPVGHYGGQVAAPPGLSTGRASFAVDVTPGDQTLPLLLGCGYVLDSGTYKPTSSMASRKTLTMACWEDGRRKRLRGAAGTARFEMQVGRTVNSRFDFRGGWVAPDDNAMPATSPAAALPYVCRAATLTIGAAAVPYTGSIAIDLGAEVEAREDVTHADGVIHFLVGARRPIIELDPEARLVAASDPWAALAAGSTAALVLVLTRGATTLTVSAPAVQYMGITSEARGSRSVQRIRLGCMADNGDDELTFAEA